MMNKWTKPASEKTLQKTAEALKQNNITPFIVGTVEEAKKLVEQLIPKGAEVHTNASVTLDQSGISKLVNESGDYNATKPRLMNMNRETESLEMQKIGSGPEWALGSVHAVTENGEVLIASNSGSNLAGYAYGAPHVLWVVGSQKLVKDLNEGYKRVYEHTLPLESERARKAYGVDRSYVRKLLLINSDGTPGRISMIIVRQASGY